MKISEAIAKSIIYSKSDIVSCVPGFGGTQVFEALARIKGENAVFSFHEEVAFALALGAGIASKRSAILTKVHGLSKAANAVTDSLYMSINAGMVVFVFEDKKGQHSDNILPGEPLLKGLRLPYFIAKENTICETIYQAYEESESLKIPVAILLDADMVDLETSYHQRDLRTLESPFKRDLLSHLVVPVFGEYQYQVMEAKLKDEEFGEIKKPDIPQLPDGLPPSYGEYVKAYMPLFDVFKEIRGDLVFGDTGISTLFAFPPYNCVDACTYMGGSVAMAVGAFVASHKDVWAVTGDFSFVAAGHLGLIEAASRKLPIKILICKNNKAQTTGGQHFSEEIISRVLKGFSEFVVEIPNPEDKTATRLILQKAAKAKTLQIIIANFDHS